MKRGMKWGARGAGAFTAVALLAHCGGGAAPEARDDPEAPALGVLRQEVATTLTFVASADATVDATQPAVNIGGKDSLSADLSPQQRALLRFDITGVSGQVTQARLRLYATRNTPDGPHLGLLLEDWQENKVTWNAAPRLAEGFLGDVGAITTGSFVEYDLSSVVSGNGVLNLALVPDSTEAATFASRETVRAERRPQLVLTVEPIPDCMPRRDTRQLEQVATFDGYASQSEPTRRSGLEPVLKVDTAPSRQEAFLQFGYDVPDGWNARQVKLRLYATDGTTNGPLLQLAATPWPTDATGLQDFDWTSRPGTLGAPVGNAGLIAPNTWVEYDVTSALTARHATYGFGLLPESADEVYFASANAPTPEQRPRLSLSLETDPYCTYRGGGGGRLGWTRQNGGQGKERLHALATDAQGGFVAAGLFGEASFPYGNGFALARYSANGAPVWSRQISQEAVHVKALTVTAEGSILVAGTYSGTPNLGTGPLPEVPYVDGLFLAKFGSSGQPLWAHGFIATTGYIGNGYAYAAVTPASVATDAQGDLVVAGQFYGTLDLGGGPLFAGAYSVADPNNAYPGGFVAKFTPEGQHVWSRALTAYPSEPIALVHTVSTDTAGNVLLGGRMNKLADLGDGPQGRPAPFIAKYTAGGALLWKRLFPDVLGEVVGLQPLGASAVAFSANFGGDFLFATHLYHGGTPGEEGSARSVSGFTGTLNGTTGEDGWLRTQGTTHVGSLVVGSDGTLTVSGYGAAYDLGGGTLGTPQTGQLTAYAAHYSASGGHLWSRLFDSSLRTEDNPEPRPLIAAQPAGALLLGTDFALPFSLDSTTYTTHGGYDLFFFQLKP